MWFTQELVELLLGARLAWSSRTEVPITHLQVVVAQAGNSNPAALVIKSLAATTKS